MTKKKKSYTFRKFINDAHLWLGIPSGIVLFVICLTGTIYTFTREITEWVDSDKFTVEVSAVTKPLPLTQLVAGMEKSSKGLKVTSIAIPEEPTKAWTFTMAPKDMMAKGDKEDHEKKIKGKKSDAKEQITSATGQKQGADKSKQLTKGKGFDRSKIKNYLVNPYTGAVNGDAKTPTSKFFSTVMGLHRWLLLDTSIGRPITGISTLIFIVLEITGLILWLPGKLKSWSKWNAWKQGFSFKFNGSWKRINYDLHNTLGFYTLILVTIMAVTGLCFSFEWFRDGFGNVFGAKPFAKEEPVTSIYTGALPMDLDKAVASINNVFSYEGNVRVNLPKDSAGTISLSKTTNGFFTVAGSDRIVLDQYTGVILKTDRFSDKKTGEQIVALIYPIHVGEIFGTFTKIIYFIVCMIATSLPVTGTMIWINKFNKNADKKSKKVASKQAVPTVKVIRKPVMTAVVKPADPNF